MKQPRGWNLRDAGRWPAIQGAAESLQPAVRRAIRPPVFGRDKVHRERLVDMIRSYLPRKLIVISAPPGYGKTTLLADFQAHSEFPFCWVRLSDMDADSRRLAMLLVESLTFRFPRLARYLRREDYAGLSSIELADSLAYAIGEKVTRPFIIGLDDVQYLNHSKSALEFLEELVRSQPDQMTLIVSGRAVPDMRLTQLVVDGEVVAIGPTDLALTREEIIEVKRSRAGVNLEAEAADRMLDETGGWVMGVILSGNDSVRGMQILAESSRTAFYDYLTSVVLEKQPKVLREFMLEASALPFMTSDACNAVLRMKNSRSRLEELVRRGLFVAVVKEHSRTYEFHSQIREFLLEMMRSENPKRLSAIQTRAAAYLAFHGAPEEAVRLYLDAGNARMAGRLAASHAARLEREGRYGLLETWRDELRKRRVSVPHLDLSLALALVMQGRGAEARILLRKWKDVAGSTDVKLRREYHLALVHELVYANKLKEAIRAIRKVTWGSKTRRDWESRADCLLLEGFCEMESRVNLVRAAVMALEGVGLEERLSDPVRLACALSNASATVWAAHGPLGACPAIEVETRESHPWMENGHGS